MGTEGHGYMTVALNGERIDTDAFLREWLNAYEYHRDLDKRQRLAALTSGVPDQILWSMLLERLREQMRCVHEVAHYAPVFAFGGPTEPVSRAEP